MLKRAYFIVLATGMVLGVSCPGTSPDSSLTPRPWAEPYGNKQNTGFNAVHSTYGLPILKKWTSSFGPTYITAPAIGADGTAWVTNYNGELVGFNPDGSEHRRRKVADSIVAPPTINTDTNEIFVVGENRIGGGADFESHINRLDAGAGLLSVSSEPLHTGASPKLWKSYLFIPSHGLLKAFDQSSLTFVGQAGTTPCFNLVCGTTDIGILDFFEYFTKCVATFGLAPDCTGFTGPVLQGPVYEPSVAIFDQANVVGDTNKPIIVTVSPVCASGFRFYPAGDAPPIVPAVDRHFELLWSYALVEVDCDYKSVWSTTPVALPGGAVVIGDVNGRVLELDAITGEKLWERKLSEPIQCPPISALSDIFVVEDSHLATLNYNGVVQSEVPLIGTGLASALSLDYVYVATTEGLHTFGISQQQGQTFAPVLTGTNSQAESVAVGQDGSLYVTSRYKDSDTPESYLAMYSSHGSIAQLVAAPSLVWQRPTDGESIQSAPGQPLMVSITGPGSATFQGKVIFTSNLDGVLCDSVTPSGSSATCATSKALTIGTHSLTAFATDTGGETRSASITVNVVDTPPNVAISSPSDNSSAPHGSTVTFTAQVNDPDQASFPADHVQWQSSIDGNIGTGASFTSNTLSQGTHIITCTATDNAGMTGSASVTFGVTE